MLGAPPCPSMPTCWPRWRQPALAGRRSRTPPSARPSSRRSPTPLRVGWICSRSRPCSDASLPTNSSRAALERRKPRCPAALERGTHRAERFRRRAAPLSAECCSGGLVGISLHGPAGAARNCRRSRKLQAHHKVQVKPDPGNPADRLLNSEATPTASQQLIRACRGYAANGQGKRLCRPPRTRLATGQACCRESRRFPRKISPRGQYPLRSCTAVSCACGPCVCLSARRRSWRPHG